MLLNSCCDIALVGVHVHLYIGNLATHDQSLSFHCWVSCYRILVSRGTCYLEPMLVLRSLDGMMGIVWSGRPNFPQGRTVPVGLRHDALWIGFCWMKLYILQVLTSLMYTAFQA